MPPEIETNSPRTIPSPEGGPAAISNGHSRPQQIPDVTLADVIATTILSTATPHLDQVVANAGRWFLVSGIQEPGGGVARYYRSNLGRNARVSAEITGYALSTYLYLDAIQAGEGYAEAAKRSAEYLTGPAWSGRDHTIPFEPVAPGETPFAYFFDCGIIGRGLIAAWRHSRTRAYLERANDCGLSMVFDFMAETAMHPIIELPSKVPLAYEPRWSREPGCYQLKSAVAWRELAREMAQLQMEHAFERMARYSLATHHAFFDALGDAAASMDRLHPYCYFLEALLFDIERPGVPATIRDGMARTAERLRRIAPEFVRSDVYAQLLRVRLFADALQIAPLDTVAAREEASALAEFQVPAGDARTEGGFCFGRKNGEYMPFVNPVSTAFALQALRMWQEYQNGGVTTRLSSLI